jgi:predicted TIM-barrel fold metal-dependent hydrolase
MFDAHLHIFDPAFPLIANEGFVPDPFTAGDYLRRARPLGIDAGAIVAASPQGLDPEPLFAARAALGEAFVVVLNADPAWDDAALTRLATRGARGLRYNLYRGVAGIGSVLAMAHRAAGAGLHAELYADAATLATHADALAELPGLAIDHLGLTEAGLPVTLDLARAGAKVKATGFGRVRLDVARALEDIASAAPDALMFGTDLPSTRAARPFADSDVEMVRRVLGADAEAALEATGRRFYRV